MINIRKSLIIIIEITVFFSLISVAHAQTLGDAVDNTKLNWETGGNADWFVTNTFGFDSAQSGDISDYQNSWIETTVTGPGTLNFRWKVYSWPNRDYLELYIDEVMQERISGYTDWEQKGFSVSSGVHTIRWKYVKDPYSSIGSDCGWLDDVEFIASNQAEIESFTHTMGTIDAGSQAAAIVIIKNTGTTNRNFWAGLSYKKQGSSEWIDVSPQQSVELNPSLSGNIQFSWTLTNEPGTYDIWTKIWDGYDPVTNQMIPPSYDEQIDTSAFTIIDNIPADPDKLDKAEIQNFIHTTGTVDPGSQGSAEVTIINAGANSRSFGAIVQYKNQDSNEWINLFSRATYLESGISIEWSRTMTLPNEPGIYDMRAIITNNDWSYPPIYNEQIDTGAFTILDNTPTDPDELDKAEIQSFIHTTGTVDPGSQGSLELTIINTGANSRGFCTIAQYKNQDSNEWNDIIQGWQCLSPGDFGGVSATWQIPDETGIYDLRAIIMNNNGSDPYPPIYDEKIVAGAFSVVYNVPSDQAKIEGFIYPTEQLKPWDQADASVTIRNVGLTQKKFWVGLMYQKQGLNMGENPYFVTPIQSRDLSPGETETISFTWTLPNEPDTYDIVAIVGENVYDDIVLPSYYDFQTILNAFTISDIEDYYTGVIATPLAASQYDAFFEIELIDENQDYQISDLEISTNEGVKIRKAIPLYYNLEEDLIGTIAFNGIPEPFSTLGDIILIFNKYQSEHAQTDVTQLRLYSGIPNKKVKFLVWLESSVPQNNWGSQTSISYTLNQVSQEEVNQGTSRIIGVPLFDMWNCVN